MSNSNQSMMPKSWTDAISSGPTSPTSKTGVGAEIDRLREAQNTLAARLSDLADRLGPLLIPEKPLEGEMAEKDSHERSEVAVGILDITRNLETLNGFTHRLIQRIDL